MPLGLPQSVKDNIEKCRAAAIAAVDVYNRPGPRFRTAHYIVLIVLAWAALHGIPQLLNAFSLLHEVSEFR